MNDLSRDLGEVPSGQSMSVEALADQAVVLAQHHADGLGLNQEEAKVLFTYTLEQLMVMLYMRHPQDVMGAINRVRARVKQDFGMAARLPN